MKHFTKQVYYNRGNEVFRLIDDDGNSLSSFDYYVEKLITGNFAYATIKRYMEVVAVFLDYLVEAGVFGVAVPIERLNAAVEGYLTLRVTADRIRATPDNAADPDLCFSKPIVAALDFRSIEPSESMTAAINRFLRLSEVLARTEMERAAHLGLAVLPQDYQQAIRVVDGFKGMPSAQRKALRQASMLANVMRLHPKGMPRPRGLATPKTGQDVNERRLDFPLASVADLIRAATTSRERAFWLLLVGAGLRTSEALNVRWPHVDFAAQKIFVEDPNCLRRTAELPLAQRLRFKGRSVSDTFIIQPFRDQFFGALADYINKEYVPGCDHDFVFQDIRPGPMCGSPMYRLSDTARNRAFKRAARRAGVADPGDGEEWTLHSLRHAYGVYLVNYLPVPGGYGLPLKDAQTLMGHKSKATTAHYARTDDLILASKLEYADGQVTFPADDRVQLRLMIAGRLRQLADQYERGELK